MLVTAWPLPNGTRLLPRLLSNAADAPYLGEAGILFNLTRLPAEGVAVKTGGSIPGFVRIFLALQLGLGLILLTAPILSLHRLWKQRNSLTVPMFGMQFGIWLGLWAGAFNFLLCGNTVLAVLLLLCAQFFPRHRRKKPASEPPATTEASVRPVATGK